MKTKTYKTLESAMKSIVPEDKEYVFVWHVLKVGGIVKKHYHAKANEFLVTTSGTFVVTIGKEEKTFDLNDEKILVLFLPKQQPHSFIAKTKITYFVFRDQKDKIVYTK